MWDRSVLQPWPLDSRTGCGASKTFSPSGLLPFRGSNPNGEGVLETRRRRSASLRRHARLACAPCFACEKEPYVSSPVSAAVPKSGIRHNLVHITMAKNLSSLVKSYLPLYLEVS